MKRYILSSSNYSKLDEIESFAKSIMEEYNSSTICNIVSKEIEDRYGLKAVPVTIFNNGTVFNSSHYCNVSDDYKTVYDFTGDQFIGNPYNSDMWIYYKSDYSDIYVSRDHKSSESLSQEYPTLQPVIDSDDSNLFGIIIN